GVRPPTGGGSPSPRAGRSAPLVRVRGAVGAAPADPARQLVVISGTAGSDRIVLGTGADSGVTLSFDGTALADLLPTSGKPFALVVVLGGGGNDTLDARGLSVRCGLAVGPGNDT